MDKPLAKGRLQPNRDWRAGFLFISNHLALDFLNTRPVQNGEPVELLADFSALLGWFRAAALLDSRQASKLQQRWDESAEAQRVMESMWTFRERLRKVIIAWENGGAIHHSITDELNRLMAEYPMRTRLKTVGASFSTELWFEPKHPEDLFAPLAHSAATLFAAADRTRVRKCGRCVLHFLDVSKKGTRRWCSMQLCGNRLKVAAYATRQRLRQGELQGRTHGDSPKMADRP